MYLENRILKILFNPDIFTIKKDIENPKQTKQQLEVDNAISTREENEDYRKIMDRSYTADNDVHGYPSNATHSPDKELRSIKSV